jgi:hypothetical protein
MDLQNKRILILGGSGLVGQAVARRVLEFQPSTLALVALREPEVKAAADALTPVAGNTTIETAWGDVFLPVEVAQCGRGAVLADPQLRAIVLRDLLDDMNAGILERSYLFQLFREFQPHAVVDSINTATAFAYQDVVASAQRLLEVAAGGSVPRDLVEAHILTIPTPQLIRHMQIIVEAMRATGAQAYVKIGTSGTGGMGFNVPYTHSEERPSRTLLTKSALAGAHSLLLFLLGRTPGAPATVEVKPTATIAWKDICFGPIKRHGEYIKRFDCPKPLPLDTAFGPGATGWEDTGNLLESVFADVGENGLFAKDEFETVTALGQMEFITPQEIAEYVVMELQGYATGRDIVAALDSATAGPTYRAGILRNTAVHRLRQLEEEHGVRSVAFEMLGPPRLTKLLYEAFVWSRLRDSIRTLAESDAASLAAQARELLAADGDLRSLIVSVGLPVILSGAEVYRGQEVLMPPHGENIDRVAARGWVDLRPENCESWIRRARRVLEQARNRRPEHGSGVEWNVMASDDEIVPSRFATWIFRYEEDGERIKR